MYNKFVINREILCKYYCDTKDGVSSWVEKVKDAKIFDTESQAAVVVYGLIKNYSGFTNYKIEPIKIPEPIKISKPLESDKNCFGVCPYCKTPLVFHVTHNGKYYFKCGDPAYCGFGGIINDYLPQYILEKIQGIVKDYVKKSVSLTKIIEKMTKEDRYSLNL